MLGTIPRDFPLDDTEGFDRSHAADLLVLAMSDSSRPARREENLHMDSANGYPSEKEKNPQHNLTGTSAVKALSVKRERAPK